MKGLVSIVIPTHNRKDKVIRLLGTVFASDYQPIEVIVVDDFSSDGTSEAIALAYPNAKVIRNEKNLLLAGSRNVGLKNSSGKFIFVIDDDNIIDRHAVKELVSLMDRAPNIGLASPIMYYLRERDRIWCAGVKRNMITSKTTLIGKDEVEDGSFGRVIDSTDCPNAFMVRREVLEKVGYFDELNFPIHYDEADFGERVRRHGFRMVFFGKAKVWHDIPLPDEIMDKSRAHHVHNDYRAYYASRNRLLFHRKYSKAWQFAIYLALFNSLFTLYYLKIIIFNSKEPFRHRLRIAGRYFSGAWGGG